MPRHSPETYKPKQCRHCGAQFRPDHSANHYCSLACLFWSKVEKRGSEECWPWRAATTVSGYGQFTLRGTRVRANRVSMELVRGVALTPSEFVCHTCDNPRCVNPAHLVVGTHADNMRDMCSKGRQTHGVRHYRAKLDDAAVREIRRRLLLRHKLVDIAKDYGVDRMTITLIRNGRNWKHVQS